MRYKDIYRLKGKERRSICQVNHNLKKTRVFFSKREDSRLEIHSTSLWLQESETKHKVCGFQVFWVVWTGKECKSIQ
jgi:hypothetical protein